MEYPTVSIYRDKSPSHHGGCDIAVTIKSREILLPCEADIIENAIITALESRGQEVKASEGYVK